MIRPSVAVSAAVLRRFDPTPEELDIADVLDHIQATHRPGRLDICTGCGDQWPCTRFVDGQHLAVQFVGRAADRCAARALATLNLQERS